MRKATTKEKSKYLTNILSVYTLAMLVIIYGINLAFDLDPGSSYAVAVVSLLAVGVMLFFTGQVEDKETKYILAVEE